MSETNKNRCNFEFGGKKYLVDNTLEESTKEGKAFKKKKVYCKAEFDKEVLNYFNKDKIKKIEIKEANICTTGTTNDGKSIITERNDNILEEKNEITREIKTVFGPYCSFFGKEKLIDLAADLTNKICEYRKDLGLTIVSRALTNKVNEVSVEPETQRQSNFASNVANLAAQHQSSSNPTDDSSASALDDGEKRLGHNEDRLQSVGMTATINVLTPPQQGQQIGE